MTQKNGRIINSPSYFGVKGAMTAANYCAAKAGVIGLTKSNARELARYNITVNVIMPFAWTKINIDTPEKVKHKLLQEVPLGRIIDLEKNPEEITGIAVFLASDEASYITGQVIGVDGGVST